MTKFNDVERAIIRKALTIAAEDGAIYPGGKDDAEDEKLIRETDAVIDEIRRKLAKPT